MRIDPSFESLPDSAFLRQSQIIFSKKQPNKIPLIPISSPTLWRMVKAGTFPRPFKLSSRVTAWLVADIRKWIEDQSTSKAGMQ